MPPDVFEGRLHQPDVGHQQKQRANGDLPLQKQGSRQRQRGHNGQHIQHVAAAKRVTADHVGPHAAFGHVGQQRVEPLHDVRLTAVGPNIFRAADALFDVAVQFGVPFAHIAPHVHRRFADNLQQPQRQQAVGQANQPHAPLLAEQQRQNTNDQHGIAQHPHQQPRKELRQVAHVPVDPFDQFARGFELVEAHVQPHGVGGQISPQAVGSRPAQIFAQVSGPQLHPFLGHGHDKKERTQADKQLDCRTGLGRIEKAANHLGAIQLQANAHGQQAAQSDETGGIRP